MLLDRQVDGMIFVSCEMTNLSGEHDHYGPLLSEGARIVFVNGALNTLDIPSVGVDERAAAADGGVAVPDELSVVGFDGIEASSWTNPPLTTIEQPIAEIAQTAVDTLRTLIEDPGRPLPNSYFRPNLRVRSSTGPAPK
jgi:DNA-binding LacI/PurR family transcriptional regulator